MPLLHYHILQEEHFCIFIHFRMLPLYQVSTLLLKWQLILTIYPSIFLLFSSNLILPSQHPTSPNYLLYFSFLTRSVCSPVPYSISNICSSMDSSLVTSSLATAVWFVIGHLAWFSTWEMQPGWAFHQDSTAQYLYPLYVDCHFIHYPWTPWREPCSSGSQCLYLL